MKKKPWNVNVVVSLIGLLTIVCMLGCPVDKASISHRASVASSITSPALGLADSPWPKIRRDAENSGRSDKGTLIRAVKWQQVFTYMDSSPAVGPNDTLYVCDGNGYIEALNALTGDMKWETFVGNPLFPGEFSSPAIGANGVVYTGGSGSVYALNGKTGTILWQAKTASRIIGSSPTISSKGLVYIGGDDGYLYAIDSATGVIRWKFKTGALVDAVPAVGADGTVYFGSYDHYIYALNGATGTLRWKFLTNGRVLSSPAIGKNGTIYEGSFDQNLYALASSSGVLLWKIRLATSTPVFGIPIPAVESSPAIGHDGTVYVNAGNYAFAINGTTGSVKWKAAIGDVLLSSPVVGGDGTVYDGSDDGYLYALDNATGSVKSRVMVGKIDDTSPAIGADGTVFIGSLTEATFYAIH